MAELLYPKAYTEGSAGPMEQDSCVVPQETWLKWVNTQTTEVLCVTVKQFGEPTLLVVSGGHQDDDTTIYLPQQVMLGMTRDEYCSVRVARELPPVVTKVVIQPLDNELYHCDIGTAVSKHLSNWNLLHKHQTLTVECEELGGYPVDVFIQALQPADTVILRGEVRLELAESLENVVEWTAPPVQQPGVHRPPTPYPEADEDFSGSMLPISAPKGFQPFGGTGHRLG